MKLDILKRYIDRFKQELESNVNFEEAYKWEALKNFQTHWNVEKKDLLEMYDISMSSKYSGRLWGGSTHSAKSMMIELIKVNPEFIRSTFRDLFEESRELLLRMDRFGYHCDQILNPLQKNNPKYISHYHNDYKILSVYLTFNNPQEYTIFEPVPFAKMLENLQTLKAFQKFEIVRFFKLSKTLYKFLSEDSELVALHKSKINSSEFYQEPSMLLVHDFYITCYNLNV